MGDLKQPAIKILLLNMCNTRRIA